MEPITLEQIAAPDPTKPAALRAVAPRPATIVDGGAVSTFPVWLFDDPDPKRPTFGFTLTGGEGCSGSGDGPPGPASLAARVRIRDVQRRPARLDERAWATRSTTVRTVAVETTVHTPDGASHPIRATDFRLDARLRELLVANGRAAATRYLDELDPSAHLNSFHATPLSGGARKGSGRSGER